MIRYHRHPESLPQQEEPVIVGVDFAASPDTSVTTIVVTGRTEIVSRMARSILAVLAEKPTVTVDDIIRRGWSRATVLRLGQDAVDCARKALADHRATMATN